MFVNHHHMVDARITLAWVNKTVVALLSMLLMMLLFFLYVILFHTGMSIKNGEWEHVDFSNFEVYFHFDWPMQVCLPGKLWAFFLSRCLYVCTCMHTNTHQFFRFHISKYLYTQHYSTKPVLRVTAVAREKKTKRIPDHGHTCFFFGFMISIVHCI